MQCIHVSVQGGGYDILIENGLMGRLGERLCDRIRPARVLLVMDETVDGLYGDRVRRSLEAMTLESHCLVVPSGVAGGTLNALNDLAKEIRALSLGEKDCLLVVGGAMMCDIGGFALYNCRCRAMLVQAPTTLIGMTDWAVMGKTAVEHKTGTKMIGSFFIPSLVLIDPQTTFSLSDRHFENGMGEVIKCACAADAGMFHMLENLTGRAAVEARMEEVVWSCLSTKASLTGAEQERMRLGHNLAYAIEMAQHHRMLLHGEAVGVGMLGVTRFCELVGLTAHGSSQRIEDCLNRYHLPLRTTVETEPMHTALRSLGAPREVVLERIGWSSVREMGKGFLESVWFGE